MSHKLQQFDKTLAVIAYKHFFNTEIFLHKIDKML